MMPASVASSSGKTKSMQPTAIFCRTEEVRQRALAGTATLENVKRIAIVAAAAWAKEGAAAEHREARKLRAQEIARAGIMKDEPACMEDRNLSENPDRALYNRELA
ncbi:hypothetical protein [Sphingomonas kyeonggiensis]|uniref:Uncharacterized protein n=1 Tax=Sphingomonas kyeonggiensis TaxID=1268553 RepID=A0A7W6NZD7_9SPHN|nr:hypothetical protein [Sphingomonas kyeonggiensis]MBB4101303.1 hypothetical protein [Sphingomonas kyeonggiensis]